MCDTITGSTTGTTIDTDSGSYSVQGMTCTSCAAKVSAAVDRAVPEATTDVDPATGTLTVTGTELDDSAIRTAIHEAGYQVA